MVADDDKAIPAAVERWECQRADTRRLVEDRYRARELAARTTEVEVEGEPSAGIRPTKSGTKRNTVERAINRIKQFRSVATRYDKRGYVFLGTATAAAVVIWLRT